MKKPQPIPLSTWLILGALGLIFAQFAGDRAILGVLKTTISRDLGLSNRDYSLLVTSFMVPYTLMYLFVGGWVDRFGVRRMLLLCGLGMACASILAGTAHGLAQLSASRLVLGAAEAGVVPAVTLAVFTWFPSERRAFAYTLANTVQQSAYILCPPVVAGLTLWLGWRASFLISSACGLIIAVLWLQANRQAGSPPPQEDAKPGLGQDNLGLWARIRLLLSLPSVRILIIARILSDPFWFFFQYWQTAFLQEKVGLSLARVGQLTWIPPLVYMAVALGFSSLSDMLITRGWTPARARLLLLLGATLFAPAAFLLPFVRNEFLAILLVTLVWTMCSTWLNMSSVFMGALVPRHSLASSIGIMSALGGVTSITFNLFVGALIDRFGYDTPFFVGACLHPLAALLLALHFLRKPRQASVGPGAGQQA